MDRGGVRSFGHVEGDGATLPLRREALLPVAGEAVGRSPARRRLAAKAASASATANVAAPAPAALQCPHIGLAPRGLRETMACASATRRRPSPSKASLWRPFGSIDHLSRLNESDRRALRSIRTSRSAGRASSKERMARMRRLRADERRRGSGPRPPADARRPDRCCVPTHIASRTRRAGRRRARTAAGERHHEAVARGDRRQAAADQLEPRPRPARVADGGREPAQEGRRVRPAARAARAARAAAGGSGAAARPSPRAAGCGAAPGRSRSGASSPSCGRAGGRR